MSKKLSSMSGRGWGKKGSSQPGLSGYRQKKEQANKIQQSGLSDSKKYEQGAIEAKSGLSDSKKEQQSTVSKATRSTNDSSVEIIGFYSKLGTKQQRYLDGRSITKGLKNFVNCIDQDLPLAKELLREVDVSGT